MAIAGGNPNTKAFGGPSKENILGVVIPILSAILLTIYLSSSSLQGVAFIFLSRCFFPKISRNIRRKMIKATMDKNDSSMIEELLDDSSV